MPLSAGIRLGPYEIVAPLGAGGMGEVYRARDTRLGRTVAIKVLPPHVAAPEARQRFEREARAVSALNHPHICTLHDIGCDNGVDYMVMECVEGETLADRLKKGPLPLDQALGYGIQIAEALDRAHRSGVVHRDLKPGNIMICRTGVKILDFGLAKIGQSQGAAVASGGSLVETLTTPLTGEGTIVGTLQYMAPEQLEGKEADARTDIFALGAVLYEMVSGKRAFDGKSHAGLISAVMTSAPEPVSPAALDRVIGGCLEKEPEQRWQSAHDVGRQLRGVGRDELNSAERRSRPPLLSKPTLVIGALLIAVGFLLGKWLVREQEVANTAPVRFGMNPPESHRLALGQNISFSPDGRYLAFVTYDNAGKSDLWVRPMRSPSPQRIDKTEGAQSPFWSPDSQSIAFFAEGKLKRVTVSRGAPQVICNGDAGGGAWSRDGIIVFSSSGRGGSGPLYQVSATGGVPKPVTRLDESREEVAHNWPQFLPDGRRFLYFVRSIDGRYSGVYVQDLNSDERIHINTPDRAWFTFAPPRWILSLSDSTLVAQELDLTNLTIGGEARIIADDVVGAGALRPFTVSNNGALAYRSGPSEVDSQLVWYNRQGKRIGKPLEGGAYSQFEFSPDDRSLVVERMIDGQFDLWRLDLSNNIFSRITFGPENERDPIWSPDASRIAYLSRSSPIGGEIHEVVLGSGKAAPVFAKGRRDINGLDDWTPDGKMLIYHSPAGQTVFILPVSDGGEPRRALQTPFRKDSLRVSPSGRWVTYTSDESGQAEVYVATFPGFSERRQISSGGGLQSRWRRDEEEIFYLSNDGKLMSVECRTRTNLLETDSPRQLFQTAIWRHTTGVVAPFSGPGIYQYAATQDGQRFLIREPIITAQESVQVVLSWPDLLKQ